MAYESNQNLNDTQNQPFSETKIKKIKSKAHSRVASKKMKSGGRAALYIPSRPILTRNGPIQANYYAGALGNFVIGEALNDLKNDGYCLLVNFDSNPIYNSEYLLSDLGFSPVKKETFEKDSINLDKNFSLFNLTNEDQTINNSNILDPDINSLTPEPVRANDKFISENDSFYEFDDNKPENLKNQNFYASLQDNKKLIIVATKLSNNVRVSNSKMLPRRPNRGKIK